MQINPTSNFSPTVRAASAAAPAEAQAGPADAVELLGELGNLREKFAAPHERLADRRSELGQQSHALYQKASDLAGYQENLALLQPSVGVLAKLVASGELPGLLEAVAADAAERGAVTPLAGLALSTLKGLNSFARGPETDWTTEGVGRLAEGLGSDPSQHAAQLDRTLGRELFITDQARQEAHPEPFIQGELSAANLEGLSGWMTAEQAAVGARVEAAGAALRSAQEAYTATNDELQAHWHGRRGNLGERVELAKSFMAHLDAAEKENPAVVKEMLAQAPEELKPFFPRNVLDSYRAQLKKAGGDAEKVDWRKLLGQLERTSLG